MASNDALMAAKRIKTVGSYDEAQILDVLSRMNDNDQRDLSKKSAKP
jgi:hypothetical protein